MFAMLFMTFLTALPITLAHCVGMCGGIVVAYSSIKAHKNPLLAHSLYNLGRLISYVIIGLLFYALGQGFALSGLWKEFSSIIVGLLLIVYAVCFAFFPNLLRALEPTIEQQSIFGRFFGFLLKTPKAWSYAFIGILNGFLPCGLVYFFALSLLNTNEAFFLDAIIQSVLIMCAFWVATLVPMGVMGVLSSVLVLYRRHLLYIGFLFMLGFGLLNIYQGIHTITYKNQHKLALILKH